MQEADVPVQNPDDKDTDQNISGMMVLKIEHSSETHYCKVGPDNLMQAGDRVVVNTRYGKDLARVLGPVCAVQGIRKNEMTTVVRKASEKDIRSFEANKPREEEALRTCREKIRQHKLDMKLVSAHYLLDENKVLFFFTAVNRVDFRELVKDLVSVFRMRIELRQIGVRDEARVLGGVAVCGRSYCCHGLSNKLRPVSIKMAKEQNLSLNSMKISGPCGRLLCCLSYESDFYKEEKSHMPNTGTRLMVGEDQFRVSEVNILSRRIRLSAHDGRIMDVPFDHFHFDSRKKRWNVELGDLFDA